MKRCSHCGQERPLDVAYQLLGRLFLSRGADHPDVRALRDRIAVVVGHLG